jgi:hypothetical protein
MKIKVTKNYDGNIEFIYGKVTEILTNKKPSITITDDEYNTIPEHKQYLITNLFVLVDFIEEEEEVKKVKK